jgi:tripartite ATP-independent transporter DctP family solute receptor
MIITRRAFLGSTAAAGLAASLPAGAATEITLGHVGEPGSLFDQSCQKFAEAANAKLGGSAKVTVYGSSQLGSDSEMLKKLKLGTMDLALPSSVMSSVVDEFGLFEMPYLVKDRDHMRRIREQIVLPELAPLALERGYRLLGVWENGFRQITNNKRPIKVPDDLQGLKLRVPKGVWRVKMFQTYGANPSPMAFSEVFVALQTGVMDGEENPLAQVYPARFYEVQKYLSMSGHVYTPGYLVAGRSWERLDPKVQKALGDAAMETQDPILDLGAKLDEDLLGKLEQQKMQVNDVDKQAFIDKSHGIYEAFAKEVPAAKAMIAKAQSLATAS